MLKVVAILVPTILVVSILLYSLVQTTTEPQPEQELFKYEQVIKSGWFPIAPTVDGVVGATEWQSAWRTIYTWQLSNGTELPGEIYVGNNATHLFLGLVFLDLWENPHNTADYQKLYWVHVHFDTDGDGLLKQPEDAKTVGLAEWQGQPRLTFRGDGYFNESKGTWTTDTYLPVNFWADWTRKDRDIHIEFSIPLDSSDHLQDGFHIKQTDGRTFGMAIRLALSADVEDIWASFPHLASPAPPNQETSAEKYIGVELA